MSHAELLQRLLPPSSYDAQGANLVVELVAEGNALDAAQVLADSLGNEFTPDTTGLMLADWERVAGLPDFCAGGLAQTTPERRRALLVKIIGRGGLSAAWFIALAATLGYTITITLYQPQDVGMDITSPIYGAEWRHVWQINAPLNSLRELTVADEVDMPLALWGNSLLECVFTRLKPAHSVVLFSYT